MKKILSVLLVTFLSINIITANVIHAVTTDEEKVDNVQETLATEPSESSEEEAQVPEEKTEVEQGTESEIPSEIEETTEPSESTNTPEEETQIPEEIQTEGGSEIEEPQEESTEEQPIVGAFVNSPIDEENYALGDIEQYFDIDEDNYTFDGEYHIPTINRNEEGPEFAYLVMATWARSADSTSTPLPSGAKNAGNYILYATISYSTAKTIIGEIIYHETKTIEIPFVINKKEASEITKSTTALTYNGKAQHPTLYADGVEMVEDVDYTISTVPNDSIDAGSYTATVDLKNYILDGDVEQTSVDYTIEKRSVTVTQDYTDEYNPSGVRPSLSSENVELTEGDDYSIVELKLNDQVINENEDGKYELVTNGDDENYTFEVEFTEEFLKNNEVENESNIFNYTITKAKLNLDFKPLYYTGENQKPVFFEANNKIENIADYLTVTDPTSTDDQPLYSYSVVGNYYVNVSIKDDMLENYVFDESNQYCVEENLLKVGYRINKRNVEFDGWVLEDPDENGKETITASLGSLTVDFIWKEDSEGNVSLEYNGFNPFLFLTEDGKYPIPVAKYAWYDDQGNKHEAKKIERTDCTYLPLLPSETLKLGVGNYYVNINLSNDNYVASNAQACFEVTPKPVTLKWTNTTIDISNNDLNPEYEIEGLAPIDKLGFELVITEDGINWETTDRIVVEFGDYYKYSSAEDTNPECVAHYPLKYRPTAEGRYKVDVKKLVYRLSGLETCNYVLADETSVSYVVVDKSTVHTEGHINVGTVDNINKNIISTIDMKAPTETEMISIISKLAETDPDAAGELLNALNDKKNINVYLVANTVEDTTGLILPTDNSIVVDLELFAYVEGENTQYPIHDTGTKNMSIDVTLSKAQADALGYGPGRAFYIARYHGTDTTPSYTQMVDPIISGTGDDTTYTFTLSSNKFSDFCIYTGTKPNNIPYNPDHIVPYTQA